MLEELRVHQVTLEMQNQELRESQRALERARMRYFELFDFAPIACFVFDDRHHLQELNLAAVELLGGDRALHKHRPFFPFVLEADRSDFHKHLTRVLAQRERLEKTLRLVALDSTVHRVQLVSQAVQAEAGDHPVCLSAAVLMPESAPTPVVRNHRENSFPSTRTDTAGSFMLRIAPAAPVSAPTQQPLERLLVGNGEQAPKLLLADDECAVRNVTARLVEELGFQVEEVSNARECLETFLLAPESYSVVMADFNMPELDGLQLRDALRQHSPELPFVLLSGSVEPFSPHGGSEHPRSAFLAKPFTLHGLREVLQKVLAEPCPPSPADSFSRPFLR